MEEKIMSTTLRLFMLEDDPLDADLIIATLEEAGYACQWERVETQAAFLAGLDAPDYDLILADYNLPAFDGLTALRLFCERGLDVPFILVSGTLGEETAIESLRAGATDYVLKDRISRLGPVVRRALREKEEQQRLKQAEAEIARLATVIEQAAVTVIITDLEWNIVYANPAFETNTGYTVAEALGQKSRILQSGQQDAQFYRELWDTVAAGDAWTGVLVNERKDGGLYHAKAAVFPIQDPAGEIVNYVLVKQDITEQVQAQARVKHLNAVLRAIRGVNQLTVREKDRDRLLQSACAALVETRGYHNAWIALLDEAGGGATTAQAMMGTEFPALAERLARGEWVYCVRQALAQADVLTIEDPAVTCGDCPLSGGYGGRTGMAVRLEHGDKVYGLLTVSIPADFAMDEEEHALLKEVADDISFALHGIELEEKRKRAEESLRESEERFRQIAENIRELFWITDPKTKKLLYVSPAYEEMWGCPCESAYGRQKIWFEDIHPEDRDRALAATERQSQGYPTVAEYRIVRPDGSIRWIQDRAFPIKDAQGQLDGITGVASDITERKQAQEALRESEERYRTVVEYQTDLICRCLPDGTLTFVNQAYCLYHGQQRQELIGHSFMSHVPPEERERVAQHLASFSQEKPVATIEHRAVAAGGKVRWQQWINRPIFDEQGNVTEFQAVGRDITERRQAQEALRESEGKYRLLADNTFDVVWTMDFNLEFTYVNPAVFDMLGFTPEEWIGTRLPEHCSPEELQKMMNIIAREMENPEPQAGVVFETYLYNKSGEEIACEISSRMVFDETGKPIVLQGTTRDITERKQAEGERERLLARIQEQAQRVQQIIVTVPEGVLLLDRAGHVVLANPLGKKNLVTLADAQVGDTLTRLGDRPLAELLTSPPKGLWHEVTADGLHFEIIARPLDIELESEEACPEPVEEPALSTAQEPALSMAKELALSMAEEWVLVIRDVTQEREMQQRVQRQERLAAVGQLAGGIAHDFNNLLTTIMLYAQMPLTKGKPDLPPNAIRSFEIILDESRRAAELVQQILDFSRRSPIDTSPMDLGLFVQKTLRVLERTITENINLRFAAGPEEHVVNADPTRIQQVLMNLATNGRDAMPEGGEMRFELSRVQVQPGEEPPVAEMGSGEWVCLAVSDTGTGIPPEALARIFEPFFTTKEPGKGTGLGLAQVHGIVALHGGHIGVETKAGKGTTFRVYLRASGAEEEVADEGVSAAPEGKGETILLVEDNKELRAGGQTLLESLGYRVLTAANGREALEVYQAVKGIALVITDLVMPEMGGKMLLRKLREMAPDLKALAITGYTVDEDVQELKEAGFLDVSHKPFDVGVLAQIIRRALDEK